LKDRIHNECLDMMGKLNNAELDIDSVIRSIEDKENKILIQ